MPAMLVARLYRVIPLLVVLAIIAVAVYLIVSWRYTPTKAKEVLIKTFTALNLGLSALFLLATLYAWIESNAFVADFFLTCMATTLVLYGITWLCKRSFLKAHPNYQWKLNSHASIKDNFKAKWPFQ